MTDLHQSIGRRAWPIALLLFAILPVLAFPEIVFGRQTLWRSDITLIHYPYHIMVADEWLAGRVPLWNPFQHIGIPLLAEGQVGPLYPLGLLFLSPLPPSLELSLFVVLHFSLACVFTFALARCLGMGRAPAMLAGLAFGMGGFLMAQVANLNIMTGAVWLPLILCAVIAAVRRRSVLLALIAGIPLALQAFTAQPQVVLYTMTMLVAYAAYRLLADVWRHAHRESPSLALPGDEVGRAESRTDERRSWPVGALLVALAIVSGLLLSAPQLLPSYELQQHSVRSQELGFDFLTKNSLPPLMGLNLLLPGAFGNNVVGFKGGDPFEEDFIYVGFLPLALAFFCWTQRRRRDMPFFLLLLVGATLLALGRYTPLYQVIIQHLPGFSLFRIPSRWLMAVNLALAVLAGYGLQTLTEQGLSRRRLLTCLVVLFALSVGLALVWVFRQPLLAAVSAGQSSLERKLVVAFLERGFTPDPVYRDRLLLRWLAPLTTPTFLLAFNLLIATLLLVLHSVVVRRLTPHAFSALVLAAVSLDLVVAGGTTVNPVRPDDWWQQLSGGARYVLERLDEGRVWPLGMGSEEAAVRKLGQYFPSAYRVPSAGGHGSPLMLARHDTFLHTAHPVQQVQLLGVRYILTEGRMGQDAESTYPSVYADGESVVYGNRDPLPRAFAVHEAVPASSPEEALSHFKNLEFDPRRAVVLETMDGVQPRLLSAANGPDSVAILHDTPDRVEIGASLSGDGYLVLLDTWYPGWQATVDGDPATIYRADYIVRAVFVPAGDHVVRFEYRPLSFRLGVWLAAALVLTILVVYGVRRRGLAENPGHAQLDLKSSGSNHKIQRRMSPYPGLDISEDC